MLIVSGLFTIWVSLLARALLRWLERGGWELGWAAEEIRCGSWGDWAIKFEMLWQAIVEERCDQRDYAFFGARKFWKHLKKRAVEEINTCEFAISAFRNVQFMVLNIGEALEPALNWIWHLCSYWRTHCGGIVGYSRNAQWRKLRSATKMANGHWPWIKRRFEVS